MINLKKDERTTLGDLSAAFETARIKIRTCGSNNHLIATFDGTRLNVWLGAGNKPCPKDLVPIGEALAGKLPSGKFDETTSTVICTVPVAGDDSEGEATKEIQFRIEPNGRYQRRARKTESRTKANSRRPTTNRRTKRPVRR